jgi:hypothetical protein
LAFPIWESPTASKAEPVATECRGQANAILNASPCKHALERGKTKSKRKNAIVKSSQKEQAELERVEKRRKKIFDPSYRRRVLGVCEAAK